MAKKEKKVRDEGKEAFVDKGEPGKLYLTV